MKSHCCLLIGILSITASGAAAPPNSDPNYLALRNGVLKGSYAVHNLVLTRDVGVLTFRSGTFSFLPPVLGKVAIGVFTGDGNFHLKPLTKVEKNNLARSYDAEELDEPFKTAVICFTDSTFDEIKRSAEVQDRLPSGDDALHEFRGRMRRGGENPRSELESILTGEDILNVEAELLGELYNPAAAGSFSAYLHGPKYSDLRFLIKPKGALPQLPSPEEVALIHFNPSSDREGVWYLCHRKSELEKGTASSSENPRLVVARRYRIVTTVANNDHLSGVSELEFEGVTPGTRVIHFSLLPSLRVSGVTAGGSEIPFIQESKKQDGSLYVVLPEPIVAGQKSSLTIEYEGDKVIEGFGGGNFSVRARTSWYPNVNTFSDRAVYDLTFRSPRKYKLVSVGKLEKEWQEGGQTVSHWTSETPLAIAGFNYGTFRVKSRVDDVTKYTIEAYANPDIPDYLRQTDSHMSLSTTQLAERTAINAQNAIRCFTHYFGELPYGRIAITQQPEFNFGQSWPTLVYLPLSAFLDPTQRWRLMGSGAFSFGHFIQEVTPHEVAHQWWGHILGWATYHDQWLSEGFADFSAGLYLMVIDRNMDQFAKYWARQRQTLLEKNGFGFSGNDAGPLWLGLRLDSPKYEGAYNRTVYPKGGYVLEMLRMLMYDPARRDERFIEMMKDFVKTYSHQAPSTEDFQRIVERHMTPSMDLEGTHTMDWFFGQWVFGTEIPKYRLEYSLTPQPDGTVLLKGHLIQSGVSDSFRMRVPLYVDLDGKIGRVGVLYAKGSHTMDDFQVKLPKKPKRVVLNLYNEVLAAECESKQI